MKLTLAWIYDIDCICILCTFQSVYCMYRDAPSKYFMNEYDEMYMFYDLALERNKKIYSQQPYSFKGN